MQKVNLAFAGCGFLGLYHTGVSTALKCHGHSFLKNIDRYLYIISIYSVLNGGILICYVNYPRHFLDFLDRHPGL